MWTDIQSVGDRNVIDVQGLDLNVLVARISRLTAESSNQIDRP